MPTRFGNAGFTPALASVFRPTMRRHLLRTLVFRRPSGVPCGALALRACVTSTRPRWRERPSSDSLRRVNGSERLRSALDAFRSPSPLALADDSSRKKKRPRRVARARSCRASCERRREPLQLSTNPRALFRVLPILTCGEPHAGRSLERDADAPPLAGEARLSHPRVGEAPARGDLPALRQEGHPSRVALRHLVIDARPSRAGQPPRPHTDQDALLREDSSAQCLRRRSRNEPELASGRATILANADTKRLCYRSARPP